MQTPETTYLSYLQSHQDDILSDLIRLVSAESPTYNFEKATRCKEVLKTLMEERLGVKPVREYEVPPFSNHLAYEFGEGEERVLCVGHYDTVWETDAPEIRIEGNELHGPGVYDMKGGIISLIWALKASRDLSIDLCRKIVIFFNSDEEMGSATSRPIIMELAKGCKASFVMEPPSVAGAVTTSRKGCSEYVVTIHGKAAHAGSNHSDGINAIQEMAYQVQYLHSLTNYAIGTTFNVGLCSGGSRPCIVPDLAQFTVNCRYTTDEEGYRCYEIAHGLTPVMAGVNLGVSGEINRMPMIENEGILQMYEKVRAAGAALGLEIGRESSGGTSDANDVAHMGVPVIDGMGPAGHGAHSADECIYLDHFLPRIGMLVSAFTRV